MKRITHLFAGFLLIVSSVTLLAQPQYYNSNTGTVNNSFPFNQAAGKMIQTLIAGGEFNQPTPAPNGNITRFYVWISQALGPVTYTNFKILFADTNITSLPTGSLFSGNWDTVFSRASYGPISAGAGSWLEFVLDRPHPYNNANSLVVQIEQCGASGTFTGFSLAHTNTPGLNRRTFSVGGCPYSYNGTSTYVTNCGITVAPPLGNPATICRNGLNKVLNDHSTLRDTISITANPNYIVKDLVVKIDTLTHTWDADVSAYIRHGAVSTKFINQVGGSGDNFIGTTIKDSAVYCQIGSTGCNTAPFTGTFRPSVGGSFAGFINQPMTGDWILTLTDTATQDTGTLRAWCITIRWQDITSGQTGEITIPSRYILSQNYPNPFNPSTSIKFALPKNGDVKLVIYDMLGREVRTLVNEHRTAGTYEVVFDASELASGIYFYTMRSGDFTETKKMILIK